MNFTDFNFDPKIQACLDKAGFTEPTPIQEQAIPIVMAGHDIMGLAQTGTGKTAAFILPILEKISKQRNSKVKAVVIAPTRELAQQIHDVAMEFGKSLGVRTMTIYGGASMGRQVHQLRRGVDLVVACPGRLYDHMRQGTIRLDDIQFLVLDEADQMFDMGFIPTIRRILEKLPASRQTLMFSATMPKDIRMLANDILQDPETVEIGHSAPVATVSHALFPVPQHLKTDLLVKLLQHTNTDSVLVFVKMKHSAQRLCEQLEDLDFKVTSLQGNLSQGRRMASMRGFKNGEFQIMIATDIAARGIDISSISHVINYDMPDTPEAYTHRIGRTGRAAKTGDAFTFVAAHDNAIVRRIERCLGSKIERRELEDFDYGSKSKSKPAAAHMRAGNRPRNEESFYEQREPRGRGGNFHGERNHFQAEKPWGSRDDRPARHGRSNASPASYGSNGNRSSNDQGSDRNKDFRGPDGFRQSNTRSGSATGGGGGSFRSNNRRSSQSSNRQSGRSLAW